MVSRYNLLVLKVNIFLYLIQVSLVSDLNTSVPIMIRTPDKTDKILLHILSAGYAGSPAQFAITRCAEGFWSPYSLQCSPHDCGPLLSGPGLALTVSYPDNTTQLGSQATLSCSLGEIQRETSLTCTKVRQASSPVQSSHQRFLSGGMEWAQA